MNENGDVNMHFGRYSIIMISAELEMNDLGQVTRMTGPFMARLG